MPIARIPDAQTLLIVGLDLGLARGDLPLAGLQDLAEDDLVDLLRVDAGALQRRLDGVAAEVDGVERGQGPAHLAEGSPCGSEDDCAGHDAAFLLVVCRVSALCGPDGARRRRYRERPVR
jgi:hypothetical protein